VHEEFDQAARNASLDDSLNLIIGTVREVGDGPAGIDQNFVVERINQLR
jgi:hypothetical protein